MALSDSQIEYWCEVMHTAYENEAVKQGWKTNPRSAVPWSDVPESNKETMRASVGFVVNRVAEEAKKDTQKKTLSTMMALVKLLGGEARIPENLLVALDGKITVEYDHATREVVLRIKETS